MSDDKHTLGPWRVFESEWNLKAAPWTDAIGIEAPNSEGFQTTVPAIVCWTTRGGEEVANARLIAAAPDMLDALYRALFWLGNSGANSDLGHVNRPAWEAVRAAIAKAEGR